MFDVSLVSGLIVVRTVKGGIVSSIILCLEIDVGGGLIISVEWRYGGGYCAGWVMCVAIVV